MKKIIAITVISVLITALFLVIHISKKANDYNKSVPVLKINLNGTTLEEINKNSKEVKYSNNSIDVVYENKELFSDNIIIKGRGNSTWYYDKKPYQIEFYSEKEMFNLGKSKKWVLLANYLDESLIRNHIAFYLGNKLNMKYTPTGKNVDLYVDDKYHGVYYLIPKISISSDSLDLTDDSGILMELDNIYYYKEKDYYITKYNQDHFVLKEVKSSKYKQKAIRDFMDAYNNLEKAIDDKNWTSIENIIDLESFAKYYVLNNLIRNGDAYRSSFYMYKDGSKDKIHAGPIWDFDMAFLNYLGNKDYFVANRDEIEIPEEIKEERQFDKATILLYKLSEFDEFQKKVKTIWNENLKDNFNDVYDEIDSQYKLLKSSANKNIARWNYKDSYENEISLLRKKLEKLYDELYQELNK